MDHTEYREDNIFRSKGGIAYKVNSIKDENYFSSPMRGKAPSMDFTKDSMNPIILNNEHFEKLGFTKTKDGYEYGFLLFKEIIGEIEITDTIRIGETKIPETKKIIDFKGFHFIPHGTVDLSDSNILKLGHKLIHFHHLQNYINNDLIKLDYSKLF